jgi:hypothetical protein
VRARVALKLGALPVAVFESSCVGPAGVQVFEKNVLPTWTPLTVTLEIPPGEVAVTLTVTGVGLPLAVVHDGAVIETDGVPHTGGAGLVAMTVRVRVWLAPLVSTTLPSKV